MLSIAKFMQSHRYINIGSHSIFAAYLLTSKQIGLFSLASFIGTLISFPFAGVLTDILSRVLHKPNLFTHSTIP